MIPPEEITVLEIGAEGGSIKVLARTNAEGNTDYRITLRDQTLTFLSKSESEDLIETTTEWASDWDAVITSLGRWPWPMLVPVRIHPDYAARILAAVESFRDRRGCPASKKALNRWQEACGSTHA